MISVIIPAYNAAAYIAGALKSVLAQTERDLEVVVVDDCSKDGTAEIVSRLMQSDNRVKLISLPTNRGPGNARNIALQAAAGDWIALLDADDAYHPDRLNQLMILARRESADIVSDNILLHHEHGASPDQPMFSSERLPCEIHLTPAEFVRQNTRTGNGIRNSFGFMQPMLRKKFLTEMRIAYQPDTRFGEDFIFYVECLIAGARWCVTPAPLYIYTLRTGSLTETVAIKDLEAISRMEQQWMNRRGGAVTPEFIAAIKRHKRTIDHWRYTMAFRRAISRRSPREAAGVAFRNWTSFQSVFRDLAANSLIVPVRAFGRSLLRTQ